MTKFVACPVCSVAVAWRAGNAWRPIRSEGCKAIDLGAWASERHVIHGQSGHADESTEHAAYQTQNG